MRIARLSLALIAALSLSSTALLAQKASSDEMKVSIGPYVGVNYTTVGGGDATNPGYKAGLAAGGQLDAAFEGGVFFRTGVLYSMRGAKDTESGVDIILKENFIEVPVLLGYSLASAGSSVKPFILAGGLADFKISCDLEGAVSGTTVSAKCSDGGDFASTDFALAGGAGVMFPAASGNISLDARYAWGLQKIEKTSDVKHRGFTVGIAYMIPFGH